jgi:hypothetical protein
MNVKTFLAALLVSTCALARDPVAVRSGALDRPLRYTPDGGDFVIDNGTESFNRPLYTAHTPNRVDGGDKPEFAFCFPTKGGVLRLGIISAGGAKWLTAAGHIVTRYHPGSLIYKIDDPLLGGGTLNITALPTQQNGGLVLSATLSSGSADLVWAYAGGSNESSRTHFDLVGNPDLAAMWNLRPDDTEGATVAMNGPTFVYASPAGTMRCTGPVGSRIVAADAVHWDSLTQLLGSTGQTAAVGRTTLVAGIAVYVAIQRNVEAVSPEELFATSQRYRDAVAAQVTVDTPDPFINSAAGAMCIAADDIWQPPTFMHGANAWRTPLLGWRGPYALDAFGWHDRAATHLSYWAGRQNTNAADVPMVAHADPAKNLAENDWKMLHSYGNIPQSHYDMDLAFIDELYRHFLWTGDVDYVKKMWPVITRHLAWEKRCFDRDGLYEGYACIWASDGLEYNGGGAAHSTAYNYYHNLMAARMARVIGQDPAPYDAEAKRIHDAMENQLWLPRVGWYGEYKDLLGMKRIHPDAAVWTVYHAIDCQVPDSFEAYQSLRYVDTQIPHIPVRGPGVPAGNFHVVSESNWQPYEWSLNNVVSAEVAHTALAYWEGNRAAEAFNLFKGTLLDGMYLGVCPGDLPNLSFYDDYRGESYRDFGDATGITCRTFIEGLFGILPDALAGELTIRPGFPRDWDHASIQMPDVKYSYTREGSTDHFDIRPSFSRPMSLKLIWPARLDHLAAITVNGQTAKWRDDETAIGSPRLEIVAPAAAHFDVTIQWYGQVPSTSNHAPALAVGDWLHATFGTARVVQIMDPQTALEAPGTDGVTLAGMAIGTVGHHTVFVKAFQGDLSWWIPVNFEIQPAPPLPSAAAAANPPAVQTETWAPIDLTSSFNDKVTQIFRNAYLSPRSPYCSLQIPKQGIGVWSSFTATARIDDSGLRRAAGSAGQISLPSGIPLSTPGDATAKNIIYTSRWDNYPKEVSVPLTGRSSHAWLLMAGSTNPMESGIDNGEIVVTYADGTSQRLGLRNPTNWWPIDQDYFTDDYAFHRDAPVPPRLSLASGRFYTPSGTKVSGGAATVLDMPLDAAKPLRSLTVRTLSNEVVIGLMSVTLAR